MPTIPPGGGAPPPGTKPIPGGMKGRSARDGSEVQALQSEREAQKRISNAHEVALEAERESRKRIDDVRDEFVRREEAESARQEEAIENERNKGYKAIRDMQRANAIETSRLRREGDRVLEDLRNYYRDTTYGVETRGKQDLHRLQGQNHDALEAENRSRNMAIEQAQTEHEILVNQERSAQESSRSELVNQGHAEYERMKLNASAATAQAREHFDERYQTTVQKLEGSLSELQHKTGQRLEDIREETTAKLSAFNSQKSDPFYQLVNIDARFSETSDGFIVVAKIPIHERDKVSVSMKGDNLVISGARRNEDNLELSPGHKITTAAFQSYNESFPLNWPVEGRQLSRRFEGDYLIVEVPKKKYLNRPEPYHAPRPERVRAERPKFPANIPYSAPTPDLSKRPLAADNSGPDGGAPKVKTRNKGSTTLG